MATNTRMTYTATTQRMATVRAIVWSLLTVMMLAMAAAFLMTGGSTVIGAAFGSAGVGGFAVTCLMVWVRLTN